MGKSDLIEDETSLAYRLSNLRKDHDLSQKQLADQLHVTHSQISRIESGETKNPNISIVIDAARFFHVSTDYLLGITQITSPKSYDISELGLSEEAVTRLITRRIDVDILNRLLEHENFPKLCIMIRNYFDDTIAEGIMARNKVIDFAVDQLTDLNDEGLAMVQNLAKYICDIVYLKKIQRIANGSRDIPFFKCGIV